MPVMQTIHPIWPTMPRHLRGHPGLQVSASASGPPCHHRVPCPGFTTGTPSTTAPARSTATCSEGQYPGWCALLTAHCTAQPREISRLTPISFHCTYCTKTVNAWATVFLPMLPYIIRVHCCFRDVSLSMWYHAIDSTMDFIMYTNKPKKMHHWTPRQPFSSQTWSTKDHMAVFWSVNYYIFFNSQT